MTCLTGILFLVGVFEFKSKLSVFFFFTVTYSFSNEATIFASDMLELIPFALTFSFLVGETIGVF